MSTKRTARNRNGEPERRVSIRSVRREQPDLSKLASALIALAQAQAEADAQADHELGAAGDQPPKEAA